MISILTDMAKWIFHELMFFLFVWNICFSMDRTLEGQETFTLRFNYNCDDHLGVLISPRRVSSNMLVRRHRLWVHFKYISARIDLKEFSVWYRRAWLSNIISLQLLFCVKFTSARFWWLSTKFRKQMQTRMHSSRMRTTRLLTLSQHALGRWVYLRMHVYVSKHALGRRGVSLEVSAQRGVCVADTPCKQNDRQV